MFHLLNYLIYIFFCNNVQGSMYDMLSCYLCEYTPLHGKITDCNCEFNTVDYAATTFFKPILSNITQRTFFRYFQVDMQTSCPFWKENGMCVMEGCSICTCSDEEIPSTWLTSALMNTEENISSIHEFEYGWISPPDSDCDDKLGKVYYDKNNHKPKPLLKDDTSKDWIVSKSGETYVNLLLNPERYTGYSGPSATRVWQAIQLENCFGRQEDSCLEKRIFYRLMSGLQSSISTHIAKYYYYPAPIDKFDINLPLFIKAVGSHPDRLHNMYLAFIFLLRAVQKAKNIILAHPIDTGNSTDDLLTKDLLNSLLNSTYYTSAANNSNLRMGTFEKESNQSNDKIQQCREGFDESNMFQVPKKEESYGDYYFDTLREKNDLLEDFRSKFRNISLIMNCVSCERCRVWGKLQILGFGTAIKILLSSTQEIEANPYLLDRQEIIALINGLHQLSTSIDFAAQASHIEFKEKIEHVGNHAMSALSFVILLLLFYIVFKCCLRFRNKYFYKTTHKGKEA